MLYLIHKLRGKLSPDALNRRVLQIALPAIVSNITVPLLGLVDTAIAGHLGKTSYIGAIAVGGVIFNMIYWLFCFLRWGTSGLTAQSLGAGDDKEVTDTLYRSCLLALAIGVGLLVLQYPIFFVASKLMDMTPEVADYTATYFRICVWGAPAVQLLYALSGWFVGMQNSRIPMVVAIVQNGANIPLSLLFVCGGGMKIEGVALGTVIAQYLGVATALFLLYRNYRRYLVRSSRRDIFMRSALVRFLNVNRDIMLRMVCLLAVTVWFTSAGSRQGELVLAANTILFQLFYLFSFFFDGFANAGEAICGKSWGERNVALFVATVKRVFGWGLLLVVLFTTVYIVGEELILGLLTDREEVVIMACNYFHWLLLVPICGILTFVWDGIFVGAAATGHLLFSMFVGMAVFFVSYFVLFPLLGNDGLWIAFLFYLLGRGLTQCFTFKRVMRPISG